MRGGKAMVLTNETAVLEEYRRAVRDGAVVKASRIYTANPDLHRDFDHIDQEEATKHFTI